METYHLVEVQALGELGLGVHRSVVGDQDMVCELCVLLYISIVGTIRANRRRPTPHTTIIKVFFMSSHRFNVTFMSENVIQTSTKSTFKHPWSTDYKH